MNTRRIRKKWLVLQYDDRPIEYEYANLMNRNKKYCKQHGYAYKFIKRGYSNIPPYWRKVSLVKEYLKNYKGILWLDTDAVIFNLNISLDSLTNSSKQLFISNDDWNSHPLHFNTGIWIIKNTIEMHRLLDDWIHTYNEKDWLKDSMNKWHSTGGWSGTTYEQGSFNKNIYSKYKEYIKSPPCNILQGALEDINSPNKPFILHFWNCLKKEIPAFIKIYIDKPIKSSQ